MSLCNIGLDWGLQIFVLLVSQVCDHDITEMFLFGDTNLKLLLSIFAPGDGNKQQAMVLNYHVVSSQLLLRWINKKCIQILLDWIFQIVIIYEKVFF